MEPPRPAPPASASTWLFLALWLAWIILLAWLGRNEWGASGVSPQARPVEEKRSR